MSRATKKYLKYLGIASFTIFWAYFPVPEYLSLHFSLAVLITAIALIIPDFLEFVTTKKSPIKIKLKRKTKKNIIGLVFFAWLISALVIPTLAVEEYKQNKIPKVHFQELNTYLVETHFGEHSLGVTTKVLNQWHKSLIVQELNFKGKMGASIDTTKIKRSDTDSSGQGYTEYEILEANNLLDGISSINFNLIEKEDNFHLKDDTVKDIVFLSPPIYRSVFKPHTISVKHPAFKIKVEGTWTFIYKGEKPNEQEQSEITANKISFDEWNELIN